MSDIARAFLVVVAVVSYYRFALPRFGDLARAIVPHLGLTRNAAPVDIERAVRLGLATVSQGLVLVLLAVVLGLPLGSYFPARASLLLVPYGVAVGIGELALSSVLAGIAVQLLMATGSGPRESGIQSYLSMGRGGWIAEYRKAVELLPTAVATVVIVGYVTGEELMFRVVVLSCFIGWGTAAALVASTAIFAAVQTFGMASRRAALFPILGAGLIGVVNGALLLATHAIVPLVVAHLVFFAVALRVGQANSTPYTNRNWG